MTKLRIICSLLFFLGEETEVVVRYTFIYAICMLIMVKVVQIDDVSTTLTSDTYLIDT